MLDGKASDMNRSQQYLMSEPRVEEHVDPALRGRESYADPVSQDYPFWVPKMEESALSLVLGEIHNEAYETMTQDLIEKEDSALEMEALNDSNNLAVGREVIENRANQPESQNLMLIRQAVKRIKELPQDSLDACSSDLRHQEMLFIEDLSKVTPSLVGKEKSNVIRVCVASVFALPSLETLQWEKNNRATVKDWYNQTMDGLKTMLKAFLLENPNTAELQNLLDHLVPWMRSEKFHERLRAVDTSFYLLKAAVDHPEFCMSPEFPKLGVLIGLLALRTGDYVQEIGPQAMESLSFLYTLVRCQKEHKNNSMAIKAELHQRYKKCLGTYEPMRACENICTIIKELGQFLTPDQMTDLLLVAVENVREHREEINEASRAILNAILKNFKHSLKTKVPEIVGRLHSQLSTISHPHKWQEVMMVLGLLAHDFLEEVTTGLLNCQLPLDRNAVGMWRALAEMEVKRDICRLLDMLLKKLQERPRVTGKAASILPIAAASALFEVLCLTKCRDAVTRIFPRLLMALLVQVHYCTGLSLPHRNDFTPTWWVIRTIKLLLLKTGHVCELAIMELNGGWELLASPEEHYRGVGQVARTMLHHGCSELWKILYLLVPFLERGDERHRLTALAFFVELLRMPQAKRLPQEYSVIRLTKGLTDLDPVVRALCVRGLIIVANWTGKEITIPVPAMINSLYGLDGRLVVEALADIETILSGLDEASFPGCITDPLQQLFDDDRESVRSAAISLFGSILKKVKKSQRLIKEEEILNSLVPLLLHLQEGNPDMAEKCKKALDECSRLMNWKLPKQVGSRKAWHNHQEDVDKICHYLVKKHEKNIQRFLLQSQIYLKSAEPCLRTAAATFIGFLVVHMDKRMTEEDLNSISNALNDLMHDPEASVCVFAAQAHDRVLAVRWKLKYGLVQQSCKADRNPVDKRGWYPGPQSLPAPCSTSSRLLEGLRLWKAVARK
ncbi:PREDICTED: maestro heat-like repeat-containing protein family member 7 [Gavialis gangeticus]|uniref:maestro heat-like repeat-containing protein family member 7 n=1 Tax=Gavialis gangeticus TaxID=94835 RepID=UPI00092E2F8F|nr:PREDICTED: maestro heat-like repeat-containing protein family member 7 [Gavialis gangeticus]